jgi:hypothetical protein
MVAQIGHFSEAYVRLGQWPAFGRERGTAGDDLSGRIPFLIVSALVA